jgi:Carboxypeptidase regulatory-like domain
MRGVVLVLTCLCNFGIAQSSGVLVGIITTRSGRPARNTRIVLLSLTDGTRRDTTTDDLGIYAFSLLPAGSYVLERADRPTVLSRVGPVVLQAGEKRSWRVVWVCLK